MKRVYIAFFVGKKWLFVILILAFILRFYKLGEVPSSLDWDEVSNAYNAYSILETGRDEYGNSLPLFNRSFDDYKPPLYMYLNVPTVAFFGLSPFAARLPSAILGFLTVFIVYLLSKRIFGNKKIALLCVFLLTISPWHIQFSRVGFEANVGLFTSVLAIFLFLEGIYRKKIKYFIFSGIFLSLSTYAYHAQRIFIPFIILSILIIWARDVIQIKRKIVTALVIFGILISPVFFLVPKEVISSRFEATTLTSRSDDLKKSVYLIGQDEEKGFFYARLLHNRRVILILSYFENYASHFDLNFLFLKGDDNFRHHIENMGMLYLFDLPLVILGIFLIIKERRREGLFILIWLVISPIAASPVGSSPHAVRSLTSVVPFVMISSYALFKIWENFEFKRLAMSVSYLVIFMFFGLYLHNYWNHYAFDSASSWQYGYREAALETNRIKGWYQKIFIDSSVEQAYIFWLFYSKFDPLEYQSNGTSKGFDKYLFEQSPPENSDALFVSVNMPENFEIISSIKYPNGSVAVELGQKYE